MSLHSPQPPICQPSSPSGLLASVGENDDWRGRERGQTLREGFLDVLMLRKETLKAGEKSGKSRAWLVELFFLFEFCILHSQHQSGEENVHSESNWHILEK